MKNTKYVLLATLIILGFIAVWYFLVYKDSTNNEEETTDEVQDENHFHTAFVVIKDNQTLNLADFKYMHNRPCTENHDYETLISDKVHLHDNIGDVAHIHEKGMTWGNLLNDSIKLEISSNAYGYINDEIVEDILNVEIHKDDRVLIVDNSQIESLGEEYVKVPSVERIRQVESISEGCGI